MCDAIHVEVIKFEIQKIIVHTLTSQSQQSQFLHTKLLNSDEVIIYCNLCQEYLPRYGYKRTKDDTQDWVAEVPANAGISKTENNI